MSTHRETQRIPIFFIHVGKVKVAVTSKLGKEAIVAIRGPEEFCGEGALTGEPMRLATATTISECKIVRLDKEVMVRLLHEKPEFGDYFVQHLLTRTARVEADLSTSYAMPARCGWRGPSC